MKQLKTVRIIVLIFHWISLLICSLPWEYSTFFSVLVILSISDFCLGFGVYGYLLMREGRRCYKGKTDREISVIVLEHKKSCTINKNKETETDYPEFTAFVHEYTKRILAFGLSWFLSIIAHDLFAGMWLMLKAAIVKP